MTAIRVSPAARRDIESHVLWLRSEADDKTALRFADAAISAFHMLAENPKIGPAIGSRNIRLAHLRKWRIDGFANVLIFYLPDSNGVHIIRILHSAQDWWSLLDVD